MFDIGFSELLLVGLVALLVLGPERLPGAARTAGLWIGRIKRSFLSIKTEVEREIGADNRGRQGFGLGLDGALEAMQSRDGKSGAFQHPLIAIDAVSHPVQHDACTKQVACAGLRLDQLERRPGHRLIVCPPPAGFGRGARFGIDAPPALMLVL